jgi:hypothetical protein
MLQCLQMNPDEITQIHEVILIQSQPVSTTIVTKTSVGPVIEEGLALWPYDLRALEIEVSGIAPRHSFRVKVLLFGKMSNVEYVRSPYWFRKPR